jgi:hypothetical protein
MFGSLASAQDYSFASANQAKQSPYTLGGEFHVGYPNLKLTNPDGRNAYYDGIAIRGNLNLPLYRGFMDVYLSGGGKYLDLENNANSSSQYESANIIGAGAGLSFRIKYLWFGAKYFHEWGRNFSSGAFDNRVSYQMDAMEYFAGLYFRFDRLGLGLAYSQQPAKIQKRYSGLNTSTPYNESMYSLQITYDTGETLWAILGSLF